MNDETTANIKYHQNVNQRKRGKESELGAEVKHESSAGTRAPQRGFSCAGGVSLQMSSGKLANIQRIKCGTSAFSKL